MAGEDDYFGYTTAQNKQLMDNRIAARHMGEDIKYYPAPPSDGQYIEPTVNWDTEENRTLSSNEETQAAYQDSIERIHKRIMAQDPVVVYQLADQWFEVLQVIGDLRTRVHNAAVKLHDGGDGAGGAGGWSGAGADAFLARGPGATLKSLDEWDDAAYNNWMGTLTLAHAMSTRRGEMADLWERYKGDMVSASQRWLQGMDNPGYESVDEIPAGSTTADKYVTFLRENEFGWNFEAMKLQYAMAQDYWSVMSGELGGGRATVYEGPTDAVMHNPEFIARHKFGDIGVPNVKPPAVSPNISQPNITQPNVVKPNITAPNVNPNLTGPNITAPTATGTDATPDVTAPDITAPDITAPNVTAPAGHLPVIPPVVPPALPGGGQPIGAPAVRPGALPTVPGANRLLSNLPGAGGPGVLRAGVTPAVPSGEGLPPSLPQGARPGQAPPPPQIKGRGPGQGAPTLPPGQGKHGPGQSTPGTPAAPGMSGQSDQFGAPPPVSPSSPVLRNPRSTATPPMGPGSGPRRGTPAPPGSVRDPRSGTGQPGAPLRSDAAPPVLNAPRPNRTVDTRPAGPTTSAAPPAPPGLPGSPLAPPPPPTSRPVVGRPPRLAPGAPQPPEPPTGVVRGTRRSPGYEGQIASRKMASAEESRAATIDKEFDKISKLLDREAAWTVETPGGGVLDSAPARPVTSSTEPKPTLGT